MKRTTITGLLAIAIILVVLIIAQITKIEVKTTMTIGESYKVTNWFYIYFIENKGMAWGMTFINKMFLSLLRLFAIVVIGWYMVHAIRDHCRTRYIVFLSLILAGAMGNIIDSMFYGLCFTPSTPWNISESDRPMRFNSLSIVCLSSGLYQKKNMRCCSFSLGV